MTIPMIMGLGMTISCLLFYKLKSRSWRKWLGLAMMVFGCVAISTVSGMKSELFIIVLATTTTGYSLFGDRDRFTKDEE